MNLISNRVCSNARSRLPRKAVYLHTNIALGDAERLRHFAIAEAVEEQERERSVDVIEPRDLFIQPAEAMVARAWRFCEREIGSIE
jgi:hypothetical protein